MQIGGEKVLSAVQIRSVDRIVRFDQKTNERGDVARDWFGVDGMRLWYSDG